MARLLLTVLLACLGFSTAAQADDPLAAEKCVQAALNAHGHPVGAVDGQIGNGTRAAFEAYKSELEPMAQAMRFGEGSYAMWCLYMTGNSALEGDLFALQQQVETGAKVVLGFDMPEEARFRVVMRKGEDELANVNMPPWDRDAGGFRAVFDYDSVRHADNMCVVFADGWLVKDRAGKTYEASCDRMIPAMTTGNEVVWSYDLAAPASPPASASAPVPIDGIVVPEPAFADLRTEADMLIDAASN